MIPTWNIPLCKFCVAFMIICLFIGNSSSNHPYLYEITHISYPTRMFTPSTPVPPTPLEETSATWVATSEDFQAMLSKLRNATEIAVDLEHHSYRSYAGFLCLMQISDRDQDWIIDLLAVRDDMEVLNEVFTDPAIVKVGFFCSMRGNGINSYHGSGFSWSG